MPLDPITAALDIGGKLIDRLWPDKAQADAAKLELLKLQQSGELAEMTGQMAINQEEAKSTNWFVAGGRPFIMWICGFALAYSAILEPIARFIAIVWFHYDGAFPVLDTALTMQLLFGLLGLGTMRTVEKLKGVEGNR